MMKGGEITNIKQGMMNDEGGKIMNIEQRIMIIYDEGKMMNDEQGMMNDEGGVITHQASCQRFAYM
jgi:hypothetical protein